MNIDVDDDWFWDNSCAELTLLEADESCSESCDDDDIFNISSSSDSDTAMLAADSSSHTDKPYKQPEDLTCVLCSPISSYVPFCSRVFDDKSMSKEWKSCRDECDAVVDEALHPADTAVSCSSRHHDRLSHHIDAATHCFTHTTSSQTSHLTAVNSDFNKLTICRKTDGNSGNTCQVWRRMNCLLLFVLGLVAGWLVSWLPTVFSSTTTTDYQLQLGGTLHVAQSKSSAVAELWREQLNELVVEHALWTVRLVDIDREVLWTLDRMNASLHEFQLIFDELRRDLMCLSHCTQHTKHNT